MMGRGYGYGYDMMGGAGWFGGLFMLVFGAMLIAGIVVVIMWAVRMSAGGHMVDGPQQPPSGGRSGHVHDEAVAVARRRFASGEITKEQYEEIIRALG